MQTLSRFLSLSIVLVIAACAPANPRSTDNTDDTTDSGTGADGGTAHPDAGKPDSGNVTPDAGNQGTDAGHVTPDAGNVSPDAGNQNTDAGSTVNYDAGMCTYDAGAPGSLTCAKFLSCAQVSTCETCCQQGCLNATSGTAMTNANAFVTCVENACPAGSPSNCQTQAATGTCITDLIKCEGS